MTTPSIEVTYLQYGLGQHDFTVTVNAGGCESTKPVSAYLDACTGIGEKEQGVKISAYPNPNNGTFILSVNSASSMVADLTIHNSLGMVVRSFSNMTISGNTDNLNISGLNPGIYFVTVSNKEVNAVQKILVK